MKLRLEIELGDVPGRSVANEKLAEIARERGATSPVMVKIRGLAEELVDYVTFPTLVPIGVISLAEIVE